jgi:hypothetical protein
LLGLLSNPEGQSSTPPQLCDFLPYYTAPHLRRWYCSKGISSCTQGQG